MNDIDDLQNQLAALASNYQSQISGLANDVSGQRAMLDQMNSILDKAVAVSQNNDGKLHTFHNDLTLIASKLHDHEHLDLDRYQHPDCWTPVTLETAEQKIAWEVQAWLRATAPGRYDVTYNWKGVTVFFENRADAVAFKLRWGGQQ